MPVTTLDKIIFDPYAIFTVVETNVMFCFVVDRKDPHDKKKGHLVRWDALKNQLAVRAVIANTDPGDDWRIALTRTKSSTWLKSDTEVLVNMRLKEAEIFALLPELKPKSKPKSKDQKTKP